MPQKQLKVKKTTLTKSSKKVAAGNRHGKRALSQKGLKTCTPKKARLQEDFKEQQGITKVINATNEGRVATSAEGGGGKLSVLKAAIKAVAPKHKLNKTAEMAKKATKNQFTL